MERESFVFYRSFYDSLKNLSIEDRDNLSMSLYEYALNGVMPNLQGYLLSMFELIRPQIDANNKKYIDGCKGGRPKKNWENSQKPQDNHSITKPYPNVNDNVNDNVNVNDSKENNKKKVSTANAVSSTNREGDIGDRSEQNVDSVKLSKTQIKQQAIDELRHRMEQEGYSATVVNLIMDFDEVKKGTKLHKQTEKGIKAFITTLNTRDTEQGKIDVLNSAISGPTMSIWPNKYRKTIKQEVGPRVSGNMFH